MSSVSIAGDTSGSILLAAPAIAGGNTATLPAATGTVMVSGNMPAFSAYAASGVNQTISANTDTKLTLGYLQFDTANCFNTSTSRFTPNVAGYYQFSGEMEAYGGGTNMTSVEIKLYKNGSEFSRGANLVASVSEAYVSINRLIYMNGTTDYVELYGRVGGGATITLYGDPLYKFFTGVLVRAA